MKGKIIDVDTSVSISRVAVILSVLDKILIIITAIIAPDDAIATKPKLSFSEDLLSFLRWDTPKERASIKGTVKAPVVAPEASKDIAKNSGDVNIESNKIIPYIIVNNLYKGILYNILPKPKASMTAIPMETIITISHFDTIPEVTKETCAPKICKSGSATEIKNPSTKPAIITMETLLVLVNVLPITLPIGVIPISTPAKNIDKPIITNTAPIKNLNNKGFSTGVIVKFNINTIKVIGNTDNNTSFNFSVTKFKYISSPLLYFSLFSFSIIYKSLTIYLIILYLSLKNFKEINLF